MNNCSGLTSEQWNDLRPSIYSAPLPERCYFYPGRDCPGWEAGTSCGRVGDMIPEDANA